MMNELNYTVSYIHANMENMEKFQQSEFNSQAVIFFRIIFWPFLPLLLYY